ncbi:MAG: hypothetical protein FJW38_31390 [Acidobacteria bacterium]|nr:hypothetical protein [Acidobacteriota bacterium]
MKTTAYRRGNFGLALAQALAVVIGLIVTAMGFGGLFTAQNSRAEDTGTALLLASAVMILLALVLLVVGMVAGFGLLGEKAWARKLPDIAAWLAAVEFPFGTGFAVWWWKRGRLG